MTKFIKDEGKTKKTSLYYVPLDLLRVLTESIFQIVKNFMFIDRKVSGLFLHHQKIRKICPVSSFFLFAF
jgi:hypothetical protein